MRQAFTIMLVLLAALSARAQVTKEITTIEGLSSSLVHCLCQDQYGDIWIGTRNGLNDYNGLVVKKHRYDPADSCSLASNLVNAILQDRDGHLIVGTQLGVQVYDWETGRFSAPLGTADGPAYRDNINSLIQRANGEVWASGSRGEPGIQNRISGRPAALSGLSGVLDGRAGGNPARRCGGWTLAG